MAEELKTMRINECELWISDLDEALSITPVIKELANKSVLITGGTGLICSAVVDLLIRWNETHNEKIHIIVAGRNANKIDNRFAPFSYEQWFEAFPYDATSNKIDDFFSCDYVIHGASNASPNRIVEWPVETLLSNVIGIKTFLELAREGRTNRVLFISSSEVYGRKMADHPRRIDEYGGIDILNSRNSYAIGKCAAETLCASYHSEYKVDSVVLRPGHIYGPTASPEDNRISSAWVYSAAAGSNIVMKSEGKQIRSYCYCIDCATAIIRTLLAGKAATAYNVSTPTCVISIREMAELVTKVGGVQLIVDAPTEEEKKGFNPMQDSSLDGSELMELGWQGLFSPDRGFSHTIEIIKKTGWR